jgi:hypothetical protein
LKQKGKEKNKLPAQTKSGRLSLRAGEQSIHLVEVRNGDKRKQDAEK